MSNIKQFLIKKIENNVLLKKIACVLLPLYLHGKQKKQNKIFLSRGAELLAYFKSALDKQDLKFWLTSGTLLGAYREHRLLGHDLDLDVAMFAEDREKASAALIAAGFKLEHEFGVAGEDVKEQSFCYKEVKIDIFYIEKTDKNLISHVFYQKDVFSSNKKFHVIQMFFPVTDFVEYDFLGSKYLIPEKTAEYLSANYGEDFMTPNKSWDYRKDIPSAIYYSLEEKQGFAIFH